VASVLIIDDHLDQCRPLVRLLQMSGHDAMCVESGLEALAWLGAAAAGRSSPDLVICDAMMPDLDGSEVLRRIRRGQAGPPSLPVVMHTAVGDAAFHDHLRSLGADDVWVKTQIDLDQILRFVARYDGPDC
jgi:CheY-like chemotaxis protein